MHDEYLICLLTNEFTRIRVSVAKKLPKMYPECSKRTFDGLVTCNETWVYFYEPKRKCSNRVCATRNVKRPIVAKRARTFKKIMYVIFFDSKGTMLQIPVTRGKTITAKFYRNIALRTLKKIYQIRRAKTGLKHLRLLHDHSPAHKALIVTEFFESEKVKVLPHPLPLQTLPLAIISLFHHQIPWICR